MSILMLDILPDFGKHNIYIWSTYSISIAVLLGFTVHTLRLNKRRKK